MAKKKTKGIKNQKMHNARQSENKELRIELESKCALKRERVRNTWGDNDEYMSVWS